MEEIKRLLYNYAFNISKIKVLEAEIALIDEREINRRHVVDNMPNGNTLGNPTEKQALKIIQEKTKKAKELEKLKKEVKIIDAALTNLDDGEKELIHLKYIKGYNFQQVAIEMDISRRTCFNYRDSAFKKIERALDISPKSYKVNNLH